MCILFLFLILLSFEYFLLRFQVSVYWLTRLPIIILTSWCAANFLTCQLYLGTVFEFNASCIPMLNDVSCLSESCFLSCDFDLFICSLAIPVSNYSWKITLMFMLEFQSDYVSSLKLRTHFGASSYLIKYGSLIWWFEYQVSLYPVRLDLSVTPPLYSCL